MPPNVHPLLERLACGAGAVAAALRFLTRVPIPRCGPGDDPTAPPRLADIAWALPVAGAIIGGGGAAVAALAAMALPALAAATIAVGAMMAATGALHEDGFADSLDALGGRTRERRLGIMRDSRIGTFGAAGLMTALLLRVTLLSALLAEPLVAAAALVAAGALGRAAAVWMLTLPPARSDGLGAGAGLVSRRTMTATAATAGALGILAMAAAAAPDAGVAGVAAAAVAALVAAALARHLIGGQTGDAAGGAAVTAELASLIAIVAALGSA